MRYDIPLPRLLDDNGGEVRRVNVVDATVNLNIMPLSTATMTLPDTESVPMRSWVEMYTSQGSAGIFRVRSPGRSFGQGQNSYQLDHGIVEVGDYVIKGESDYDGAAPAILQSIWTHYGGSKWQLGAVEARDRVTYSTDYGNILSAMIDIVGQLPNYMMAFDFGTTPWTVSIVERPETISGEARLSRNIVSCKISEDDSNLCTRLKCYSNMATLIQTMDASTLSTYGVVEQVAGQDEKQTQEQFLAECAKYLSQHKDPLIAISIDLRDLQAVTGEDLDGFTLGSLYRVALPDHSLTYEQTVCTLDWKSVYGDPAAVTITLGNEELAVNGVYGGSGGAGSAAATAKSKQSSKNAHSDHIARKEIDGILHEAGLEWDAEHVLIFAKDSSTALGEMYAGINVAAGKIDLIASEEDLQNATTSRSLFQITSSQITAEVTRASEAEGVMSSRITQTADAITSEVTRATTAEGTMSSQISQSATEISTLVTKTGINSLGQNETLYSQISQSADNISTLVTKTGINNLGQSETLYSEISQNATDITLKVSKGDVSTQLAVECGNVTISGGDLVVSGYITSTGLSTAIANMGTVDVSALRASGNITASGAVYGSGIYLGSSAPYTSVGGAIASFGNTSASGGTITIPWTKLDGTTGNINFNIADTQYYRDGVSAKQVGANSFIVYNESADTTNYRVYFNIEAIANDGTIYASNRQYVSYPSGSSYTSVGYHDWYWDDGDGPVHYGEARLYVRNS